MYRYALALLHSTALMNNNIFTLKFALSNICFMHAPEINGKVVCIHIKMKVVLQQVATLALANSTATSRKTKKNVHGNFKRQQTHKLITTSAYMIQGA